MSVIDRQEVLTKIEEFDALPSVPQIILRVREISENPKSSVADLANIVLSDHTLTSKILKIANSAFYAEFSNKVSTITQAVTLMGFRTVQNVVMSLALYDSLKSINACKRFDFKKFWTHSLATGVIGKLIAAAFRYKVPEEAFIAGFMHNIGMVILAASFPEEYDVVIKKMDDSTDQLVAEKAVFGLDHTKAGSRLAEKWNLPTLLAQPISHHHRIKVNRKFKSNNRLVDIVYLSDKFYTYIFKHQQDNLEQLESIYRMGNDLLDLTKESVDRIIAESPGLIRDIASELDIVLQNQIEEIETGRPISQMTQEAMEVSRKLDDRTRELTIIQEAGEAIKVAETEEEILQTTLEQIYRGIGIGRALLLKIDHDARQAKGILGFGVSSQETVYQISLPLDQGIIARTITDRQMHTVLDTESRIYEGQIQPEEIELFQARAFVTIPLEIGNKVEMVMVINNPDPAEPIEDERLISVNTLVSQASMAIEKIRLKKKLAELQGEDVNELLDTLVKYKTHSS